MKPLAVVSSADIPQEERLDILTRLNAEDLTTAFKLQRFERAKPIIDWIARIPSRRFSRQIQELDELVNTQGLAAGGKYMLSLFSRSVCIEGQEHVPEDGPVLVLSNHPGTVDIMALWVALEKRRDLHIIAAERELLRAIPNISRRLLYVAPQTGGRAGLLRGAVGHLHNGGALLNFPAGKIEPDATVRPGALASLKSWSTSIALFVRMVPQCRILPVAVGGVISNTALRNPLLNIFSEQKDKEWAAATLQVLLPYYRDTHTHVAIGSSLHASDLIELGTPEAITAAVTERMVPLLTRIAGDTGFV